MLELVQNLADMIWYTFWKKAVTLGSNQAPELSKLVFDDPLVGSGALNRCRPDRLCFRKGMPVSTDVFDEFLGIVRLADQENRVPDFLHAEPDRFVLTTDCGKQTPNDTRTAEYVNFVRLKVWTQ
ncbi:hypothetical protein LTR43_012322, partial [Exophiala xenobiotica]